MANPMAGFCGDYCGKCPSYPGECAGCVPEMHPECHFVRCCLAGKIEHCGYCGDFPCARLVEFRPDDRPGCPPGYHIGNLTERKKVGTGAWLEGQRKKWPESKKPRG
jgi:hypothetical protein